MFTKIFLPESMANFSQIIETLAKEKKFVVSNALRVNGTGVFEKGVAIEAYAWDWLRVKEMLGNLPIVLSFAEKPQGFEIGKYAQQVFDTSLTAEETMEVVSRSIDYALKKQTSTYFVVIDTHPDKPNKFGISANSSGHANHDYWQQEIGSILRKIGFPIAFHHVWLHK